ncbi:hypothetical protein bAD24_I00285 [Burkholderia sp. AD24]|nr:hypothetical protein bAD24_I00285 [Burkholderia sp. AD24]
MSVVASTRSSSPALFAPLDTPTAPTHPTADGEGPPRQTRQSPLDTLRSLLPTAGGRYKTGAMPSQSAIPHRATAHTLSSFQCRADLRGATNSVTQHLAGNSKTHHRIGTQEHLAPAVAGASPSTGKAAPRGIEYAHLLARYEGSARGRKVPSDAGNAAKFAALQIETMRGAPHAAASFEAAQPALGAMIAALPARAQDYYRGAQAAFVAQYECAGTSAARDQVVQHFQAFAKTIDHAYRQTHEDPAKRVRSEFNPPYGAANLGKEGKRASALLERCRHRFERAQTPQLREAAFARAVRIKHDMQKRIGALADHALDETRQRWQQACATVEHALTDAKTLQFGDPYDREIAFSRLEYFANRVFTSPENARAFKEMQQKDPARFAVLAQWEADVLNRTTWARQSISSNPFRRSFPVPEVPKSYLDVDENTLPTARSGQSLLDRYQVLRHDHASAHDLYHAALQRGPIKESYIAARMPPEPDWQQELDEVVCRLLLAPVPFGGLLADEFGPKSPMSDDMRTGIKVVCGLLGQSGLSPLQSFPEVGAALTHR